MFIAVASTQRQGRQAVQYVQALENPLLWNAYATANLQVCGLCLSKNLRYGIKKDKKTYKTRKR